MKVEVKNVPWVLGIYNTSSLPQTLIFRKGRSSIPSAFSHLYQNFNLNLIIKFVLYKQNNEMTTFLLSHPQCSIISDVKSLPSIIDSFMATW